MKYYNYWFYIILLAQYKMVWLAFLNAELQHWIHFTSGNNNKNKIKLIEMIHILKQRFFLDFNKNNQMHYKMKEKNHKTSHTFCFSSVLFMHFL